MGILDFFRGKKKEESPSPVMPSSEPQTTEVGKEAESTADEFTAHGNEEEQTETE